MKFINKTTPESKANAKRLHRWRNNFTNEKNLNFRQICDIEGITSDQVWNLLKNYTGTDYSESDLREALWTEQKGICCYCGCELDRLKTVIEHFLAKEANKYKRTYTYKNLLLSCDGNAHSTRHTIQEGETWNSIALKYEMSVEDLKTKNWGTIFRIKTDLTIIPPPKHCDAHKENKPDRIINPTELPDCWNRLPYQPNGSIDETKADDLAKETIRVLNLNAPPLIAKRKAAWKDADSAYSQDEEILKFNEEGDWQGILKRTKELLDEQFEKTSHLCVVYRAYFSKQLQ